MESFFSLLQYALQEDAYKTYMATVLWSLGKMQCGKAAYPISPWEKPQFKRVKQDKRSADEIKNSILGRIGGTQ